MNPKPAGYTHFHALEDLSSCDGPLFGFAHARYYSSNGPKFYILIGLPISLDELLLEAFLALSEEEQNLRSRVCAIADFDIFRIRFGDSIYEISKFPEFFRGCQRKRRNNSLR